MMGSMSPTIEEKMVMANIIVTPQITVRYQHQSKHNKNMEQED